MTAENIAREGERSDHEDDTEAVTYRPEYCSGCGKQLEPDPILGMPWLNLTPHLDCLIRAAEGMSA